MIKCVVVGIIVLCFGILPAEIPKNHLADFNIPSFPYAVEFLGLELYQEGQSLILQWSTASETQNMGFILERKTDSLGVWNPLNDYINNNNLRGQGTVSTLTEYTYIDSLVDVGFTYYYRISGIDVANNIGVLDSVSLLVTSTGIVNALPDNFTLHVYPNPFNPRTAINWQLSAYGYIELNIYNIQGLLIEQLFEGWENTGNYDLIWDASEMPSGVYVCVMNIDGMIKARQKLVLMK
ncbi:MAG: T9SS type A sorting domain-containing protein [Candidatus Marinimicrobia bacterium]|nr:T9SS type A sorting domain-containing protein [Candidatus Neomarinimicrobiota bacterium]